MERSWRSPKARLVPSKNLGAKLFRSIRLFPILCRLLTSCGPEPWLVIFMGAWTRFAI